MFEGILQRAQTTIDEVVAKYVGRVLIAVPLVVAAGFAIAAVTVKLTELYGVVWGLAIMAGLFVVVAILTFIAVAPWSTGATEATTAAETTTQEASSEEPQPETESQLEGLLTPELRSLLTNTAPAALPAAGRLAMRNLPVLIALAMAVYIFSRLAGVLTPDQEEGPASEEGTVEEGDSVAPPEAEASEAA